ncbi:DUF3261 domain-containing protein [Photobacterium angustum]|uniref:DUF3261 domain-containing protein n=1 Tax=Photobacterium angustum TaxID=661 RepID=A0A2S7VHT3_PHOAN|nr:DUF3261 domain-containing protein [Photobacterium angustum]PQJ61734.1 hypothetical protein BTO08_15710 [Photobacterium angustum]
MKNIRKRTNSMLTLLIASVMLVGCASKPMVQQNQVEIAPNTLVTLPTPAQLGYSLTASQLITATWNKQSHQLPVQLQVDPKRVALAGFSSWGTRILSLDYQDQKVETYVMPGLGATLPDPKQVLFNIMITLWPINAWQAPLEQVGWQLKQTPNHRQLIDSKGDIIADIDYKNVNPLKGEIIFTHHQQHYTIDIKTLQSTQK